MVIFQERGQAIRAKLFSAKNFLADIRPEFLEDVIQYGGFHLRSPVPCSLVKAAFLRRIVGVGQGCFQSIPRYFGPVEFCPSRIRLGDEGAGDRVTRSPKKPTVLHGVIAWVLMGDRGDDSLGKKCPGDAIHEIAPVIAAVTGDSMAQFRIGV